MAYNAWDALGRKGKIPMGDFPACDLDADTEWYNVYIAMVAIYAVSIVGVTLVCCTCVKW